MAPRGNQRVMAAPATVRVTFIDVATGDTLGVVDLSAARLPASFALSTTLQLGDDDWEVVLADPPDAAEFVARGALTLTLRHLPPKPIATTPMDPKKILFSLPSIADALPRETGPRPAGVVFEMHCDDWRQIEMVHVDALGEVTSQIARVEAIVRDESVGAGFRSCHVRSAPVAPLGGVTLPLDALRSAFPVIATTYEAVAFEGSAQAIDEGFAFRTASGLTVYGTLREGRVTVLGLRPDREQTTTGADARSLSALRNEHGLLLVDWCARVVVQPARN